MNEVSPEAVSYSKNLSFTFSQTLRGENVNLDNYSSYTFIIDVNGIVYQGANSSEDSASIVIIGGVDQFIYSKSASLPSDFFLTEQQKITLYKIIRDLSKFTNTATITSDNQLLEQSLSSLYSNYCG
jgi:plasmid replication initiation protein